MGAAVDFAAALMAQAVKRRAVDVPGFGRVYVREASGGDVFDAGDHRAALEAAGMVLDKKTTIAVGLALVLQDESGQRLLNPSDPAHIKALLDQPYEVFISLVSGGEGEAAVEKKA